MGSSTSCCSSSTGDRGDVAAANCSSSQSDVAILDINSKELLTAEDISLVQSTWAQAAALGAESVGTLLMQHIFEIAPEALALFPFKSEPNIHSYNTPSLKAHGARVVATLGVAVDSFHNPKALVPVLQQLALRHVGYGVKAAHLKVVGQALFMTLQDGLKAGFTLPVRTAWAKAWGFIESTMAKIIPEDEIALGTQEIDLVQESWKSAMGVGVEKVGVLLFRNIFEAAPQALQLFSFRDDSNMYESPGLKGHATKVVNTVGVAVDNLKDLSSIVSVLQDLGRKHVQYGVQAAHYNIVGQALLKTLEMGLGKAFTDQHRIAWLKVYAIVANTMMRKNYQ